MPDTAAGSLAICVAALLVFGAYIDCTQRRFPNELACVSAALAALWVCFHDSVAALGWHALSSLALCGLLLLIEVLYRRFFRKQGMGMGDIKALFSMGLLSFAAAVSSLIIGLLLLAVYGASRHERALPALPFIVPVFLVLWFVFNL